ncbi:Retrovirus-related Pol polyprotein from transposon RE1 [Cardamine amara subsp. amara]|uniref:Retrovirus-related Pol polyprotein from transposon RE1 n=1 Tax=Cardamine amara subsp. amara TaxID=228776 RepID=A0ABD0ZS18_CARAN
MAAVKFQDIVSDDFDYERWSSIVQKRLVESGVWDVVASGVSPDPTKIPQIAATINVVDLAQWRNRMIKNLKALKIMQSSLPESVFRKTISVASAKYLWDLLQKGNDNEEAKLRRLEKQFEELRMYNGESSAKYLKRVLEIVERFLISGNPKSDYVVIRKLLTSLTSDYDDAIPVLKELMSPPEMTLRDLLKMFELFGSDVGAMPKMLKEFLQILRKEESERKWCGLCKNYNHNEEDCYYNPRVVNQSGARQFGGQCFQCGERGHYARDCATRKLQQAQIDQKKNQKPEHLMLAVTFGGLTFDENMWMIYSNSSNHMTPYVKYFTTLDRSYRARVGLADGRVIMTEGKGDVKIMIKGVKKTIKNVLFVPRINRNVLSISQMTSRGYSVIIERVECIIKDENGNVFARTRGDERGFALRLQVIEGNFTS